MEDIKCIELNHIDFENIKNVFPRLPEGLHWNHNENMDVVGLYYKDDELFNELQYRLVRLAAYRKVPYKTIENVCKNYQVVYNGKCVVITQTIKKM